MKKISITESELRHLIRETLDKSSISLTPQETKLKGVFGRYEPEVSNDVIRYMRKNPRLIIQRLIDIYGEKFFNMVDRERMEWADIQGPLDEQLDPDDEFYYDREVEKREEINSYIKYMIPVVKGDEEFDSSHMIEIDFFHYDKLKINMEVDLTFEVPSTGNPKFDRFIAKEAVNYILNEANDGMDRNEMKVHSITLK